jgi:hypothetical protein
VNSPSIIYDMRVDSAHHMDSPGILAAIISVASVLIAIYPEISRRGDPTIIRTGALLMCAVAAAITLDSAYRSGFMIPKSNRKPITHEGCVSGLVTTVYRNAHDIRDTRFNIGSRNYHFNSSAWTRGFHNDDDAIREGDNLQITEENGEVTKIVRQGVSCPTALRTFKSP